MSCHLAKFFHKYFCFYLLTMKKCECNTDVKRSWWITEIDTRKSTPATISKINNEHVKQDFNITLNLKTVHYTTEKQKLYYTALHYTLWIILRSHLKANGYTYFVSRKSYMEVYGAARIQTQPYVTLGFLTLLKIYVHIVWTGETKRGVNSSGWVIGKELLSCNIGGT